MQNCLVVRNTFHSSLKHNMKFQQLFFTVKMFYLEWITLASASTVLSSSPGYRYDASRQAISWVGKVCQSFLEKGEHQNCFILVGNNMAGLLKMPLFLFEIIVQVYPGLIQKQELKVCGILWFSLLLCTVSYSSPSWKNLASIYLFILKYHKTELQVCLGAVTTGVKKKWI